MQGRGQMGRGGRMQGRGQQQQPQQQQQQQATLPPIRLNALPDHLLLHALNLLDNPGRLSAFRALGWSTKRYVQRRDNLRKQVENKKKYEMEMRGRNDWIGGLFVSVLESDDKKKKEKKEEDGVVDDGGDIIVFGSKDNNDDSKEEEKKDETATTTTTSSTTTGIITDELSNIQIDDNEILPHLGMRTDPMTLLSRLNTRRLYGRLKYYRKLYAERDAERARLLLEKNQQNDSNDNNGEEDEQQRDEQQLEESIVEMYDRDLKDIMTRERVYPKNMTIMQMAQKEWNDLIQMANYRNSNEGAVLPFDPIPPKYELLLFQQCPRAVATLASYPRSGNSLMRTLYEHTTLRVTGSDMQGGLAKHDLVGEMAVGQGMVQFVKTHYPERMGSSPFQCSRSVLLVRNPFDCIESYFHLMMTGQHTASLSDENRTKAMEYFDEYAVKEAQVWTKFHQYWLSQDIPLLLIRYEDLYRQTDKVMERTLQFVLEVKRMGTFFEERVDRCIREQQKIESLGSYKPRSAGIGKSYKKYNPDTIERMKTPEMIQVMKKLGYGFMLENPVEKWSEMPPLKGYATEMVKGDKFADGTPHKVIVLNNDRQIISRSQELQTPFMQIKKNLGIVDDKCDCDECVKRRKMSGGQGGDVVEGGQNVGDGSSEEKKEDVSN